MKVLILLITITLAGCAGSYGTYRVEHGATKVDLQTLRAARISIGKAKGDVTGECEVLTVEPSGLDVLDAIMPIIESALMR